jgi:hypothetical protein
MQLTALTVLVVVGAAHEAQGAGLRAGDALASANATARSLGGRRLAEKVPNLQSVLRGQNILRFNLDNTDGQRNEIFDGVYTPGHTSADGRFEVPDGYEMTATTLCSGDVSVKEISGEKSLVESQTTEVDSSIGFIKGSFKNSNTFKSLKDKMSKDDSTLNVAKLKCGLYQVSTKKFEMPPFSRNFALAVQRLAGKSGKLNASDAADIVDEFGTHYTKSVTMGGTYSSTSRITMQERALLASSGVSFKVGVEAAFWGATASLSVLNERQKNESEYFRSFMHDTETRTLGTTLPEGKTIPEIVQNWQRALKDSTGLALIGGFQFERLDAVLDEQGAAQRLMDAVKTFKITDERLIEVREAIAGAVEGSCRNAKPALDCSDPSADRPVPKELTVRVANALDVGLGNVVPGSCAPATGNPFSAYYTEDMAQRFQKKAMTYDMRPQKIVTWWGEYNGRQVLTGLQIYHVKADGAFTMSEKYGRGVQGRCEIVIPASVRVKNLEIFSGTYIDGIRVFIPDEEKPQLCGNDRHGKPTPVNLSGNDYFVGFAGNSGAVVDALIPLKATTAK